MKPFLLCLLILFFSAFSASSAEKKPVELLEVGITEHLGDKVSLNLSFRDDLGNSVKLGDYFDKKHPIILAFVYYECPNLCHYLLDGFTKTVKEMKWSIGSEFDVLVVSIDPKESPEVAKKSKELRLSKYKRASGKEGWHFLVGNQKEIKTLTSEVGFSYRYDADQKQYAHSAMMAVLTPDGRISRYLYGIDFKPLDLKLSLLEATKGKIGNVVDKFLLFCYHYDPKGRKYAIFAMNLMKLGGVLIMLCIALLVLALKQRKRFT